MYSEEQKVEAQKLLIDMEEQARLNAPRREKIDAFLSKRIKEKGFLDWHDCQEREIYAAKLDLKTALKNLKYAKKTGDEKIIQQASEMVKIQYHWVLNLQKIYLTILRSLVEYENE